MSKTQCWTLGLSLVVMLAGLAGCATTTSTMQQGDTGSLEPQVYAVSYDRAFQAAARAVALLSWKLTHSDKDAGIIQAQTPASIWAMGDAVSIHLTQTDAGVQVEVSSMSRQAIDWGKGEPNVKAFYREVAGQLGP